MIFVTVGTQLPFPRLVSQMVSWTKVHDEQVIFQTGRTEAAASQDTYDVLSDAECGAFMRAARVVIAHAGIGSILAAKSNETPIIIVPRRAALREHRNDHQMATAAAMEGRSGLRVAWQVEDIPDLLRQQIERPSIEANPHYEELVARIRTFVAA